jgi:hypothetical protein
MTLENQNLRFFFFGCMCVLSEIFFKNHNGHKNEELQKSYLKTICLYYQYRKLCEANDLIK